MKLKGEMVIELTDTNTGAVETVQETNSEQYSGAESHGDLSESQRGV